jgi:hypothetical protein
MTSAVAMIKQQTVHVEQRISWSSGQKMKQLFCLITLACKHKQNGALLMLYPRKITGWKINSP